MSLSAADYLEALPRMTPAEREEFNHLLAGPVPDSSAYWEAERKRCAADRAYFIDRYVWIYDNESAAWVRFRLWREQQEALALMHSHQQTIFLKARQVGLSWLSLGEILGETQFNPISAANIFSLRENESAYLLGRERLRGMWERLPEPLRSPLVSDNVTHLAFANGSHVRAFPTTAGDSYAATLALVDEADLVSNLNRLLRRVKPSIDAGGRIMLVSRSDKANPESEFKRIYRAARQGKSDWKACFLPWHVRPGRTPEWYAAQCRDALANTGSLDDVHEQYPATDAEALAPRSLDKRLPAAWVQACYRESKALANPLPSVPGLVVYQLPIPGRRYVIGVDPAEGLPGGDASSLHVLDFVTGEEVAMLAGQIEPQRTMPAYVGDLARFYDSAGVLVERINHGHAVIAALARQRPRVKLLLGRDDKPGWVESAVGKALLYDTMADSLQHHEVVIHSFSTFTELASIDRNTLSAPKGQHDDEAVSFALATIARTLRTPSRQVIEQ